MTHGCTCSVESFTSHILCYFTHVDQINVNLCNNKWVKKKCITFNGGERFLVTLAFDEKLVVSTDRRNRRQSSIMWFADIAYSFKGLVFTGCVASSRTTYFRWFKKKNTFLRRCLLQHEHSDHLSTNQRNQLNSQASGSADPLRKD